MNLLEKSSEMAPLWVGRIDDEAENLTENLFSSKRLHRARVHRTTLVMVGGLVLFCFSALSTVRAASLDSNVRKLKSSKPDKTPPASQNCHPTNFAFTWLYTAPPERACVDDIDCCDYDKGAQCRFDNGLSASTCLIPSDCRVEVGPPGAFTCKGLDQLGENWNRSCCASKETHVCMPNAAPNPFMPVTPTMICSDPCVQVNSGAVCQGLLNSRAVCGEETEEQYACCASTVVDSLWKILTPEREIKECKPAPPPLVACRPWFPNFVADCYCPVENGFCRPYCVMENQTRVFCAEDDEDCIYSCDCNNKRLCPVYYEAGNCQSECAPLIA